MPSSSKISAPFPDDFRPSPLSPFCHFRPPWCPIENSFQSQGRDWSLRPLQVAIWTQLFSLLRISMAKMHLLNVFCIYSIYIQTKVNKQVWDHFNRPLTNCTQPKFLSANGSMNWHISGVFHMVPSIYAYGFIKVPHLKIEFPFLFWKVTSSPRPLPGWIIAARSVARRLEVSAFIFLQPHPSPTFDYLK